MADIAHGEVDLIRPDGTTVPVLVAVSGFDLDGMLLRCLILTDLTTRRAAEDRVKKANEALRQASRRSGRSTLTWSLASRSARLTWSGRTRTWRRSPIRSPMTCAPRCGR